MKGSEKHSQLQCLGCQGQLESCWHNKKHTNNGHHVHIFHSLLHPHNNNHGSLPHYIMQIKPLPFLLLDLSFSSSLLVLIRTIAYDYPRKRYSALLNMTQTVVTKYTLRVRVQEKATCIICVQNTLKNYQYFNTCMDVLSKSISTKITVKLMDLLKQMQWRVCFQSGEPPLQHYYA